MSRGVYNMYYILMSNGGFACYDQISEKKFEITVGSHHSATSFSDKDEAFQELKAINQGGLNDEVYNVVSPYLQEVEASCVVEIHYNA